MRLPLITWMALTMTVPYASAGSYYGENLLFIVNKALGEWDVRESTKGDVYKQIWQKKGAGFNDSVLVTVIHNGKINMQVNRQEQDNVGRKHCKKFESTTLDTTPKNGYPRLIWRTKCLTANGSEGSQLLLMIQGNDSFYQIQKIWRMPLHEEHFFEWRDVLSGVSVCDTRLPTQPCPE